MEKNKMAIRTVEDFIRKLQENGLSEYASELRRVIAMSRKRKDAVTSLSSMTIPLLTHLIKLISMPHSKDVNKWRKEIRSYLSVFNIRNKSPKRRPWLLLEYIQKDLNDVLSSPDFLWHLKEELSDYPNKDNALNLMKTDKSLKSLNIVPSFDIQNNLIIEINNEPL